MMCRTVLQQRDGTLTNPWKSMENPWFPKILGQLSPIIINYLLGYRGWDPRKRWRPPGWSWNVIGRSCKGRRKRCSSGEILETDQKPALQNQNGKEWQFHGIYSTAFSMVLACFGCVACQSSVFNIQLVLRSGWSEGDWNGSESPSNGDLVPRSSQQVHQVALVEWVGELEDLEADVCFCKERFLWTVERCVMSCLKHFQKLKKHVYR